MGGVVVSRQRKADQGRHLPDRAAPARRWRDRGMIGCAARRNGAVPVRQRVDFASLVYQQSAPSMPDRSRVGADWRVDGRVSAIMFSASPNCPLMLSAPLLSLGAMVVTNTVRGGKGVPRKFQSPFPRGHGRYHQEENHATRRDSSFNPLSLGAMVVTPSYGCRLKHGTQVSIPFPSGPWSLRLQWVLVRLVPRCFNPLSLGLQG